MNPDELCEKCVLCHESGLTENEYCPWYGEPCGCNHPRGGVRDLDGQNHSDVVDEMRKHAIDGTFVSGYEVGRLADRIEAAHSREMMLFANEVEGDIKRMRDALKRIAEASSFTTPDNGVMCRSMREDVHAVAVDALERRVK